MEFSLLEKFSKELKYQRTLDELSFTVYFVLLISLVYLKHLKSHPSTGFFSVFDDFPLLLLEVFLLMSYFIYIYI